MVCVSNETETTAGCQGSHKRGPQSERDDGDRPLLHVKHHKGPQTPTDETLKKNVRICDFFPSISLIPGCWI